MSCSCDSWRSCVCFAGGRAEVYLGSICSLVGNGIHHCKEGILIKVREPGGGGSRLQAWKPRSNSVFAIFFSLLHCGLLIQFVIRQDSERCYKMVCSSYSYWDRLFYPHKCQAGIVFCMRGEADFVLPTCQNGVEAESSPPHCAHHHPLTGGWRPSYLSALSVLLSP